MKVEEINRIPNKDLQHPRWAPDPVISGVTPPKTNMEHLCSSNWIMSPRQGEIKTIFETTTQESDHGDTAVYF